VLANSQERFQVFAEHEFFAGPGLAPAQPLRGASCRRRPAHRIVGITMLAGALGTVVGVIAFTCLPGIHRRRPGPVRVAARVEHADRPSGLDALAIRPRRSGRAQARRGPDSSRVRVATHIATPHADAVALRRPQRRPGRRGSRLRTRAVRRLVIVREDTRTALTSATEPVAEAQRPTHSVEFGFER
jgi:hypothetical protein